MAPAPVPVRLLRSALGMEEEGLDDSLADAISELERLSLAELDEEEDPSIHRLVRSFVLHITPPEESLRGPVAEALVREMRRVEDAADTRAYRELEPLLPHAKILARAEGVDTEQKVSLWGSIGWQHGNHGRYVAGKAARAHSLREAEASFEPGHPSIAGSQSNLALVLKDLGELEEARDLSRKAYRSLHDKLGPNHSSTSRALGNLRSVGGEAAD